MNTLIYILAVIGGLSVLCFVFFLILGVVNTVVYERQMRKEKHDEQGRSHPKDGD